MKKRIVVLVLCLMAIAVFAQDSIEDTISLDDLFLEPTEDIIETEVVAQEEVISKIEEVDTVQIRGYYGGTAGFGFGLTKLQKGISDENLEFLLGANADASITVDARPHKAVRIKGILESEISDKNIANPWSSIYVDTLFLEYNLLNTAFVSFGKFATVLGNNDFIDRSTGTSFLLSLPIVLSGLNFYANADASTVSQDAMGTTEFDYKKLFVATWADAVVGPTRFTFALQYQRKDNSEMHESFGSLLGIKTSLMRINITSEVQYYSVQDHLFYADAGLYYIHEDLYTGFQYDMKKTVFGADSYSHSLEFGFRYSSIFNTPITFDLATKYQFDLKSGLIVPAISIRPWPYITLAVGVPYIFGEQGLQVYTAFIDDDKALNIVQNELSVLASVSVKVSF